MKRTRLLVPAALLVLLVVWIVGQKLRGPVLDGYEVTAQPLVQRVVATGRVLAVSRAQVGSQVTGVVVERLVQEGDVVQPGDVLAVLRSDDLEATLGEAEAALEELEKSTRPQAEAALREAQARFEQARREVERRRELFARNVVAKEALEQAVQAETVAKVAVEQAQLTVNALATGNPAQAAARARVESSRAQLDKTRIRSEVSGTVLTRNAEPGDLVQPGTVLFDIARAGDTEVLVPFDEKNLELLALGQPALCIADAYPSRPFPATVTFIAPRVDPQRGTVDVRLAVKPVPDFLREDMTVSVNVETGRRERSIALPNDALHEADGQRAIAWVVSSGKATRRELQLGLRGLTHTEVLSGLQAGDWVLAELPDALQEGQRVRVRTAGDRDAASASRNEMPVQLD